MDKLILFIDGSVDPGLKIGYGAYLAVQKNTEFSDRVKQEIKVKRFSNTSSTKLELQTLLWALNDFNLPGIEITVYTDSQNITGLMGRRKRLEQNNYFSKSGLRINNHELYKDFFYLTDQLNYNFIKLKGHKSQAFKDDIDRFFMLVDRASRNALRNNR